MTMMQSFVLRMWNAHIHFHQNRWPYRLLFLIRRIWLTNTYILKRRRREKKIAMTISGIGNARRFIPSIQGGSSITICQERKIPDRKAIKNYYLLWKMLLIAVMQKKKEKERKRIGMNREKMYVIISHIFYLTTYQDIKKTVHSICLPEDKWIDNLKRNYAMQNL